MLTLPFLTTATPQLYSNQSSAAPDGSTNQNPPANNTKPVGSRGIPRAAPKDSAKPNTTTKRHVTSQNWKQEIERIYYNTASNKTTYWRYEVLTEDGKKFRRNRVYLRKSNETFTSLQPTEEPLVDHYASALIDSHVSGCFAPPHDPVVDTTPIRATSSSLPGNGPKRNRYGWEIRRPKHF